MRYLIALITLFTLYSCSVEPKEINYGQDACAYCKMNIVDQQHAAEIVTHKGKVFMYDAIECMVRDDQNADDEIALFLVMDYSRPNTFLDAITSTYVISENIPSPMGAFLSAVESRVIAEDLISKQTGEILTWDQINDRLKIK